MLACRLIRNDELKAVCYIIIRVIIYPMSVFACACGCFVRIFAPVFVAPVRVKSRWWLIGDRLFVRQVSDA